MTEEITALAVRLAGAEAKARKAQQEWADATNRKRAAIDEENAARTALRCALEKQLGVRV